MVMDATQPQQPSPQSVGREFVRQYYTLLNKAPNHLHRFYNNNSSFIHGESTLVIGQKNIHNRIQQLNFNDCHAKISQVDAQATLGNGVVVQVTGELSNDGQPMRRFTQTFVLGAQSPKKYYVHNDIFRYQDMYSDDEIEGDVRSENGDEHDQSLPAGANEQQSQLNAGVITDQQPLPGQVVATAAGGVLSQQPQQQTIYYSMTGGRPVPVLAAGPQAPGAIPLTTQYPATGAATGIPPQPVQATAAVGQINGVVAHDDLLTIQQANASQPNIVPQAGSPVMPAGAAIPIASQVLGATGTGGIAALPVANAAATGLPQAGTGVIAAAYTQNPMMAQPQQAQQPIVQAQTGVQAQQNLLQTQMQTGQSVVGNIEREETTSPITNEANRNGTSPSLGGNSNANELTAASPVEDFKTINEQQQQAKYEAIKQQQNEPKTYANLFKTPSTFVNAAMQQQQQIQQSSSFASTDSSNSYAQNNSSSSSNYNNRSNDHTGRNDNNQGGALQQRNRSKDFDHRRTSNMGDSQQLFLGNIPHNATEDDLKTLFSRFGTILELRIHSKPGGKVPAGMRNPLNFGFITYVDAESVQNCLAHCPLYFPENSPDAQKLNVEEKRPRMRTNDMPPRQSMGGNSMNNNMNNSQRNMGGNGPSQRSIGNTGGGMMRGGPRLGGAFNRNDNRGGPSNNSGPQMRGSNNNGQSGGGNYGARR